MAARKLTAFAVLISLLPLATAAGAQGVGGPSARTEGYVFANGIRIHYWRTGGGGTPLVLAHGSSDDAGVWAILARELQGSYDVIAYDARGHGLTDPPTAADGAEVQVEDLAGLIRALGLQRPILMGHSMGSASVAHFASRYPDVPRAVILEDPALGQLPPAGTAPGTPAAAAPPGPQAQTQSVEQRRAGILARNNLTEQALVAECMRNSPKWGREECELWAPSKRRHHPATIRSTPAVRPPMSELFAKITAPTLILKADAQGETRRNNDAVTALLKQGRIVHVAGAGHNVRREGKQETLQALRSFLAGL